MSNSRSKRINTINRDETDTTRFLVPAVGLKVTYLKHEHGFIDAYLKDPTAPRYHEFSLYLLFKPDNWEKFQDFVTAEYCRTAFSIDDYCYEDGYGVIVYGFPDCWQHEYDLFLEGKFSYFRKKYLNLLPQEEYLEDTHGPFSQPSIQYHVCNRTKILKNHWERVIGEKIDGESELWSVPKMENETLNIEEIKKRYDSTASKEYLGEMP